LSYFAFTATPKPKTLEVFGTRQPDGSFAPFSLYLLYSTRGSDHEGCKKAGHGKAFDQSHSLPGRVFILTHPVAVSKIDPRRAIWEK
jgi:hypothetical protein